MYCAIVIVIIMLGHDEFSLPSDDDDDTASVDSIVRYLEPPLEDALEENDYWTKQREKLICNEKMEIDRNPCLQLMECEFQSLAPPILSGLISPRSLKDQCCIKVVHCIKDKGWFLLEDLKEDLPGAIIEYLKHAYVWVMLYTSHHLLGWAFGEFNRKTVWKLFQSDNVMDVTIKKLIMTDKVWYYDGLTVKAMFDVKQGDDKCTSVNYYHCRGRGFTFTVNKEPCVPFCKRRKRNADGTFKQTCRGLGNGCVTQRCNHCNGCMMKYVKELERDFRNRWDEECYYVLPHTHCALNQAYRYEPTIDEDYAYHSDEDHAFVRPDAAYPGGQVTYEEMGYFYL